MAGDLAFEFEHQEELHKYAESIYLMTTTISTVGYGDMKGFEAEGEWSAEMLYLMLVTFAGILLFTIVTNEIFKYKEVKTLA